MTCRRVLLACCLLAVPLLARAAQPQFFRVEGARDFLDGDLDGLSVDSEGRLRLAPALRTLQDTETPFVWSLARDEHGVVYVGTGNEGKIFKIEGDKTSLFADTPELEVHALAIGPDGKLYAGTSPDGKVYAIDAKGKLDVFYDPSDRYIWALAFDASGNLIVATGADARLHRVDRKGTAQVVLTSPETHILSLATDRHGNVYAGSSPGGIVYRLDVDSKVSVVHDSNYREVKALDVGSDGSLYAALVDGREREEPARPAPGVAMGPAPAAPDVAVVETVTAIAPGAAPSPAPRPEPPRFGAVKGAVVRIQATGEVDTIWTSADEAPHCLVRTSEGTVIGTGNKGKLYRINDDRTWTMLATLPADQVTAVARADKSALVVGTSNPGKVQAVGGGASAHGTFTSKVKDTETLSTWGRLRWEASLPQGAAIEVATRSGNTASPDSTWSAWSKPYVNAKGEPIASDAARFLQVRATLSGQEGKSPQLDSVVAAYLQRNLRPQVQSITVLPPGEVYQKPVSLTGEVEILGLDPGDAPEPRSGASARSTPPISAFSRKLFQKGLQTITWKADDPNGDTLAYDVYYRPQGEGRYRLLRKGLTDAVLTWDTSTVPSGRYVIKVVASDAPSNPPALALIGDKQSAPFDVDNTPPTVTATVVARQPLRLRVSAKDDSSIIRKTEYSIDGGRWQEIHPVDGLNDSLEESYEVEPGELVGPPPHVVVVRVMDQLGNVATARVELP